MDLVQIGKFISELRKEQALTQEQLGEKIGVTMHYRSICDRRYSYVERNAYDGSGRN